MVVFGEVLEVRREVLHLHPEGGHAEAGADAAEAARVGRVEVLDSLD
jgi:hypothetical protein